MGRTGASRMGQAYRHPAFKGLKEQQARFAPRERRLEQIDRAEPVLTVEAISKRFNVSTRTLTRWRQQGLVARRFVIEGRTKVGFLESSVRRFVEEHREQVLRGSRFKQLSESEREEIVRRARR